jgi:hypothetical protein
VWEKLKWYYATSCTEIENHPITEVKPASGNHIFIMLLNLLLTYYPYAFHLICTQTEKWNINNNNSNNYVTINNICHNYRKQCKYLKLAFEIKKQWQMNIIIVTPLVPCAMAVNPNMLNQSPTNFTLLPCLMS